jgi:TetR/AcrR family transcriptional regulator, tetracycline repressor protein
MPEQSVTGAVAEADRPRLSKAAVVERGLALADAEGLEGVTIRRLATELGVTPMALYWHFRNKDELLTGLAEAVWAELDVHVDPGDDWPDQLRGLLTSLVRVLRRHPSASQLLVGSEKRMGEAAMVASETTLEVLQRGGFDLEYSAAIMKSALFTGVMLAMSEPGFEPGGHRYVRRRGAGTVRADGRQSPARRQQRDRAPGLTAGTGQEGS